MGMTGHEEAQLIVTLLNLLADRQRELCDKFDKLAKQVKRSKKKAKRK
jgi:hypothetical protein